MTSQPDNFQMKMNNQQNNPQNIIFPQQTHQNNTYNRQQGQPQVQNFPNESNTKAMLNIIRSNDPKDQKVQYL